MEIFSVISIDGLLEAILSAITMVSDIAQVGLAKLSVVAGWVVAVISAIVVNQMEL